MWGRVILPAVALFWLSGCGSSPGPAGSGKNSSSVAQYARAGAKLSLPDRVAFRQKDPRWSRVTLGGSGEPLERGGCLVTATAMALANLGFDTDPGDLARRLKRVNGFMSNGWLIWAGIDRATNGQATAIYHNDVSERLIDRCIMNGFYPIASFDLPNGRTHWAVVLRKSKFGYHMRDPLHASRQPLVFSQGVGAFKALRCVGRKK
ncbi:MAG: hypothetical protein GDA39_07905 [Hyphomonadaceae bacterium]|nr:hypothetical protein [Hyphomonadaceae bacterium]MBC6412787.1 hypothetical protein [Hyphomonadaceae bacterium]